MEEPNVMVKDATPKKVMALASRKYSRDDRIKKDEEELEKLLAEQKGETTEEQKAEEVKEDKEPEPTSAEEKTFKKRYGDLRRYSQQKETELQEQVKVLKSQLDEATKKQIKLPSSDEDIEAWTKQYPDIAAVVETIAIKKSLEQAEGLENKIKEINEMQHSATKEKAEVELLKMHPDFADIRESDDFHNWAEEQPKWVQQALYDNDTDAKAASRAIDLYKADKGISKKKSSNKDAAFATNTKSTRTKPQTNEESSYLKESQVQKMSSQEYEKRADEVMEAIRTGKFVYDVSGSAR
jgi:hypothetical protein